MTIEKWLYEKGFTTIPNIWELCKRSSYMLSESDMEIVENILTLDELETQNINLGKNKKQILRVLSDISPEHAKFCQIPDLEFCSEDHPEIIRIYPFKSFLLAKLINGLERRIK